MRNPEICGRDCMAIGHERTAHSAGILATEVSVILFQCLSAGLASKKIPKDPAVLKILRRSN